MQRKVWLSQTPLLVSQDLEGLKVRLTARNISKVIQTFMNTSEKQIDMWMDGCDGVCNLKSSLISFVPLLQLRETS